MVDEGPLLAMARQGDPDAFQNLTEPYRHELLVYGYRLLGSFQDAEDLIQETLLRAWTRLASFAGRSSFRAWLYKIATNTGLNMLAYTSRRSLPIDTPSPAYVNPLSLPPISEPAWLEPILDTAITDLTATPDAIYSLRESVSLAFMVALHSLPPLQRAILILRDVLDWHATEVAAFLEKSVPSVNSALQRARATLATHYHPIDLEAIEAPTLSPTSQALFDHYIQAWEANDVTALVSLLKKDATFSMPPQPLLYIGRDAIRQFFQMDVFAGNESGQWRLVPTAANAQPACVLYHLNPSTGTFSYFGLVILTLDGNSVASSTAFIDPALGKRLGLMLEVPST